MAAAAGVLWARGQYKRLLGSRWQVEVSRGGNIRNDVGTASTVMMLAICHGLVMDLATTYTVLLQPLQFQMPVEWRLTVGLPQKVQVYLACWLTSIFLTCLRREAPYLVPYLPVTPTFCRVVSHLLASEAQVRLLASRLWGVAVSICVVRVSWLADLGDDGRILGR
jgi:hypothetical protein